MTDNYHFNIISLNNTKSLEFMRFKAVSSNKSAILPFFLDKNNVVHFIAYAPVPQHEGEHGRILPYQIARGTIRSEYRLGEKTIWQDKGRSKGISGATFVRDETPLEAALREGEEELGMPTQAVQTIYDCGELPYQNPKGVVYSLHMFLAKIEGANVLAEPDPYSCAARLNGVTLEQAENLAQIPISETSFETRPFKESYLTLLRALNDTVLENCLS
jgi:hypothetical protein